MKRTIFGHLTRQDTTCAFSPEPITVDQFCDYIKRDIDAFRANMKKLPQGNKSEYIEEWLEIMAAWMEIEPEWDKVAELKKKNEEL